MKKRLLTVAVLAAVGLSACGGATTAQQEEITPQEAQKHYCELAGWTYVGPDVSPDDGPSGHCEMP
jgi:ABC-type glycerol-3-phosphate transport system substrate-binding protein